MDTNTQHTERRLAQRAGRLARVRRGRVARRAGFAAVAATLALTMTAMPASAVATNKVPTSVEVGGRILEAWQFDAPRFNGSDDTSGRATVTIDQGGGYTFSGRVWNDNPLRRHIRMRCLITVGADDRKLLEVWTPKYRIGRRGDKTWSTPRVHLNDLQLGYSEIEPTGAGQCHLEVSRTD
jgi:hypothetical protein